MDEKDCLGKVALIIIVILNIIGDSIFFLVLHPTVESFQMHNFEISVFLESELFANKNGQTGSCQNKYMSGFPGFCPRCLNTFLNVNM